MKAGRWLINFSSRTSRQDSVLMMDGLTHAFKANCRSVVKHKEMFSAFFSDVFLHCFKRLMFRTRPTCVASLSLDNFFPI